MSTGTEQAEQTEYVSQRYLADDTIEDREYQTELVEEASSASTLVALPTGTGKTPVAIRVAARRIEDPGGRVLMLAPTKPLVEQHANDFAEMTAIDESEIQVFTGEVRPDKREKLWKEPQSIIVATPKVIENDLTGNKYDLSNVCHLIFDECHKASGGSSYSYIAERYHRDAPENTQLVTGLSASPGSDRESVLEVCDNLHLEQLSVMTEDDDKLAEYTAETEIDMVLVDMPEEIEEAVDKLRSAYQTAQVPLREHGVLDSATKTQSFSDIQEAQWDSADMKEEGVDGAYECLSYAAQAMKLYDAINKAESQSVEAAEKALRGYFNEAESGGSKASKRLAADSDVQEAYELLSGYDGTHPKLTEIAMELIQMDDDGSALVFVEGRDTVQTVVDFLGQNDSLSVGRFVGQNDKEDDPGMSQSEQKERLEAFRNGEYDVLVSTSVAEEGLDIPSVDLVIFFEPVPSEIRTVQRRGRTGREDDGRVVILVADLPGERGTYFYIKDQEKSMKSDLNSLRESEDDLNTLIQEELYGGEETDDGAGGSDGQAGLTDFASDDTDDTEDTTPESTADSDTEDRDDETPAEDVDVGDDTSDGVEIVMDQREQNSDIPMELDRMEDVHQRYETLETADYIVSSEVAVERKDANDFLDTITGERGFSQVKELANSYENPIVVVEAGSLQDLFDKRNIHPNAIAGALASITADYGVSVEFTGNELGTARLLAALAKREQLVSDREVDVHGQKETSTLTDQQEYVVSAFPDVGPKTARRLLTHENFGSVGSVLNASVDELTEVDGVGDKTAKKIRSVLDSEYDP